MKKLEIIVKPGKLETVKALLLAHNAGGAMFTNISGYGNQRGKSYVYNGVTYEEHIFQKVKIETVIPDETVEALLDDLVKEVSVGEIGDGKVFIYDVVDSLRLRTGERGPNAI